MASPLIERVRAATRSRWPDYLLAAACGAALGVVLGFGICLSL